MRDSLGAPRAISLLPRRTVHGELAKARRAYQMPPGHREARSSGVGQVEGAGKRRHAGTRTEPTSWRTNEQTNRGIIRHACRRRNRVKPPVPLPVRARNSARGRGVSSTGAPRVDISIQRGVSLTSRAFALLLLANYRDFYDLYDLPSHGGSSAKSRARTTEKTGRHTPAIHGPFVRVDEVEEREEL